MLSGTLPATKLQRLVVSVTSMSYFSCSSALSGRPYRRMAIYSVSMSTKTDAIGT